MSIPPIIPLKRRVHHKRRSVVSAPSGLTITAVTISVGSQLVVHFSGAMVWNGIDIPSEFQAFTQDGFFDVPIDVIGAAPPGGDWIELEFNTGCDPGAAWQLTGPMAGITPDIAWPQNGTVTP